MIFTLVYCILFIQDFSSLSKIKNNRASLNIMAIEFLAILNSLKEYLSFYKNSTLREAPNFLNSTICLLLLSLRLIMRVWAVQFIWQIGRSFYTTFTTFYFFLASVFNFFFSFFLIFLCFFIS